MRPPTKITDQQLKDWKIPWKKIEPCILERGAGFIRVDGDGACWGAIRDRYLLRSNPIARAVASVQTARPKVLNHGPGTELEAMLKLMLVEGFCCNCDSRAAQMNEWGVKGCLENREQIIGWLGAEARKRGWGVIFAAGAKAAKLGLPLSIGGLVDEAIRRAEVKEQASK